MKFNKLIPEICVTDFKKSLEFYTKILGFKIEYKREEDNFAFLSFQGSQIMIQKTNNTWSTEKLDYPFGRGVNFQIEVKTIKPLIQSLSTHKHDLFKKPKDNWYRKNKILLGNREFLVQDLDGYLLRFSEDLGEKKLL